MKKLITILFLVLAAFVSMGQSVLTKKASVNKYIDLTKNETYIMRATPATDDLSDAAGDSTWYYIIGVDNVWDANKQYVKQILNKKTGTPDVDIAWQGKYFWDDSWTTITTIHWAGSADSTILYDQSTAKHYRFYRLAHVGRDGTFTYDITKTEIQFYK